MYSRENPIDPALFSGGPPNPTSMIVNLENASDDILKATVSFALSILSERSQKELSPAGESTYDEILKFALSATQRVFASAVSGIAADLVGSRYAPVVPTEQDIEDACRASAAHCHKDESCTTVIMSISARLWRDMMEYIPRDKKPTCEELVFYALLTVMRKVHKEGQFEDPKFLESVYQMQEGSE